MQKNSKLRIVVSVFAVIVFILIAILISTTMNKRKTLSKMKYEGNLGSPYFHNRNWDDSYFCEGNVNNCENSYFCEGNRYNCENYNNSYFCDGNRYNCENRMDSYTHHGNRNGSHLHNRKCNNYDF